jgi:hypothetical protein
VRDVNTDWEDVCVNKTVLVFRDEIADGVWDQRIVSLMGHPLLREFFGPWKILDFKFVQKNALVARRATSLLRKIMFSFGSEHQTVPNTNGFATPRFARSPLST